MGTASIGETSSERDDFMSRLVEVEVLEVRSSGVVVRVLGSNREGFIRRRELSWEKRVGFAPPVPEVGQRLTAVMLDDRPGARHSHLSLRRRTNPWQDAGAKYTVGQTVQGEVLDVRSFGVFVQIEPGVDAIIRPRGIPSFRDQLPVEVLSIGDRVQGVITGINPEERRMEVNLVERLRALSIAPLDRRDTQLDLFTDNLYSSETSSGTPCVVVDGGEDVCHRYHPPIERPQRLLVIDDDEADLERICEHLSQAFGIVVDGVHTGKEAISSLQEEPFYGLAVVDVKLKDENGLRIAEQLLDVQPDLAIIFTSAAPLELHSDPCIHGQQFPFVFKEPDEIAEWIDKCCSGYWAKTAASVEHPNGGQSGFIRQLGMSALARRPLPEVLQHMLAELVQQTQVSQALVLEVDSAVKLVSIVAAEPPLGKDVRKYSVDGLYYSPVREVVENEELIYETHIQQDRSRRYRHFFPLLAYRTYCGFPLQVPDLATRHALFLLDADRQKLDREVLNKAELAGRLIQVALERALLLDYMRRYERRYSHGQLVGSLVHELNTKLDGLEMQSRRLAAILEKASAGTEVADQLEQTGKALRVADRIYQAKEELGELVEAYSRMVRDDLEAVDVNEVVRKVRRQMETRAREAGVEMYLDTQSDLPLATAVQSRLEQIVLNLVLNSVQQIEKQSEVMKRIGREKGEDTLLLPSGLVIIQTRYRDVEALRPIYISVIDTGPGIHHHQQERIFMLDTSTRDTGHGLGLYISRNLAEAMGGRIRLTDSLMFVGSAFRVELPRHLPVET